MGINILILNQIIKIIMLLYKNEYHNDNVLNHMDQIHTHKNENLNSYTGVFLHLFLYHKYAVYTYINGGIYPPYVNYYINIIGKISKLTIEEIKCELKILKLFILNEIE